MLISECVGEQKRKHWGYRGKTKVRVIMFFCLVIDAYMPAEHIFFSPLCDHGNYTRLECVMFLSSWAQDPHARCSYAVATVKVESWTLPQMPFPVFSFNFHQPSSHAQAETGSGKKWLLFFFKFKETRCGCNQRLVRWIMGLQNPQGPWGFSVWWERFPGYRCRFLAPMTVVT